MEYELDIEVNFREGQQLQASFGQFTVTSDQSKAIGGSEEFPEPFDYFLASLPLCASYYVRQFCLKRDIDTSGIVIRQTHSSDEQDKYKKHFVLEIEVPDTFPKKYHKALIAAANSCTAKKVIQAQPEFSITLTEK